LVCENESAAAQSPHSPHLHCLPKSNNLPHASNSLRRAMSSCGYRSATTNLIPSRLSSGHDFSRATKNALAQISLCALSAQAFVIAATLAHRVDALPETRNSTNQQEHVIPKRSEGPASYAPPRCELDLTETHIWLPHASRNTQTSSAEHQIRNGPTQVRQAAPRGFSPATKNASRPIPLARPFRASLPPPRARIFRHRAFRQGTTSVVPKKMPWLKFPFARLPRKPS
jgi:hypothetical protein